MYSLPPLLIILLASIYFYRQEKIRLLLFIIIIVSFNIVFSSLSILLIPYLSSINKLNFLEANGDIFLIIGFLNFLCGLLFSICFVLLLKKYIRNPLQKDQIDDIKGH